MLADCLLVEMAFLNLWNILDFSWHLLLYLPQIMRGSVLHTFLKYHGSLLWFSSNYKILLEQENTLTWNVFKEKMTMTSCLILGTHHVLRTPNEAFFHWNAELLGLGRQIWHINSGAFGVFLAELSAPIWVQWVHVFHYSTFISTKN